MMPTHPYEAFEQTRAWRVIEMEIQALIENDDLELRTAMPYVVGSLCKALEEAGLPLQASS